MPLTQKPGISPGRLGVCAAALGLGAWGTAAAATPAGPVSPGAPSSTTPSSTAPSPTAPSPIAPSRAAAPAAAGLPNLAADPELLRPLTPLDQFRPAPASREAAAAGASQVRYALSVQGLDAPGLARSFDQLSALRAGRGEAASRLQIAERAQEDKDLVLRLLRAQGYYLGDATVSIRADGAGRFQVSLVAVMGPRFRFGRVEVRGPATRPPGLARKALGLVPGDPIVAAEVEAAEANVTLRLPQQGYPFVKLGPRDVALDPDTHKGDYVLPVDPGPKTRFGGFQLDEPVFKAGHVADIARFHAGETYDSRKVDDLRRALVATRLFSSVGVSPVRVAGLGPDGEARADLKITGQAAPTHTLSGSIGYETGAGAKVEADWSALNIFPPEGALTLQGVAGTQQFLLGANFRRSNAGERDRTIEADVRASREDTSAYRADTGLLSFGVSRESTPIWRKVWTWSATLEGVVTNELAYDPALDDNVRRTYELGDLRLSGGYDRSNNLLNPTRGYKLLATLTPGYVSGNGGSGFVQATLEARGYIPATRSLVIAARFRVGSQLAAGADQLPPSRRFYEGGGGTIRGYAYQQVGPKARNGAPIGGASLVNGSLEARYRFGDFGVVGFLDAGQAYRAATPQFSDLRFGAGLGGRYYTNFGPIRLDVGIPLNRRSGDSAFGVYISIGQAF